MNRCKHDEGDHHSCAYVDAIDALLPRAEHSAKIRLHEHVADHGPLDTATHNALWIRYFFEEVQVEAEAAGLRRAGPRREPLPLVPA
jgi:hypothetical protein